jgi:phage terminase large subunit GpA-like protein
MTYPQLKQITALAKPPPDLSVSEWADAERRLSPEASAEPGRWRTDRAPYQREILNAAGDASPQVVKLQTEDGALVDHYINYVETVVMMSSAQVGKTELLLNLVGYFVDYDAAPILLLQPTIEMAQAFSKDRLAPMVRDTPALNGKISDSKSRSTGNTILHKSFPGGHITMAGANSPASLASRPIRTLLADEVDRYPPSAGTEGDPLKLAEKRTTTFWNKRKVIVSTPTIKGLSVVERRYEDSTQERYCLPCPECKALQPLRWPNIVFDLVGHTCEICGSVSGQDAWCKQQGTWIARTPHPHTRGFHLNELVSPWRRWEQIIDDFKQAKKSPETLKTFVNTSLGETFEEQGESVDHSMLYARREHYAAPVPAGACVLTAAIDTQDDRLEIGVEGWGDGEENYKIDYVVLRGDPSRPELWRRLDDVLDKRYAHESGVQLRIACAVIDSGGHYTQQVYKYVKPRETRRVYAIKGKAAPGSPVVSRPTKSNLGKVSLFGIGTDTAKEVIYARLRNSEPGAGYVHFPVLPIFDEEYFAQLTAEQCVTKYVQGRAVRVWKKTRPRNEALDIAVYNLAALYILNPNFKKLAARLSTEEPEQDEPKPSDIEKATTKPTAKRKRPRRSGYINSWRN